ncbi:MAG: restriction endonuclease [Betaproteobacteria bacterium]|nr:restriction endonuclease [Betaproteobacteria bacterium]
MHVAIGLLLIVGRHSIMLGHRPIGSAPLSSSGDNFAATFPVDDRRHGRSIIEVAAVVDRALIERLACFPEDLRTIDRRRFEEVIAELFAGFGYEVELTQRTRDGGKGIIAVKRREVDLRFLIECKRPDPGNPVGVAAVRELLGVKVDDQATKAILATTTYFSPDAQRLSERHRWELELRDFERIRLWITQYLGGQSYPP